MLLISVFILQSILLVKCSSTANFRCNLDENTQSCCFKNVKLPSSKCRFQLSSAENSNVTKISFVSSQLRHICTDICQFFPNLEEIDLSYSAIKHIDAVAFRSCRNLKSLNLYGNIIKRLPGNVFLSLGTLQALNLGFNRFKCLDAQIFEPLVNLKTLNLCCGPLENLPVSFLRESQSLEELLIYGNDLDNVDVESIVQNLPHLQVLDYRGNELECPRVQAINGLLNTRGILLNSGREFCPRERFYTKISNEVKDTNHEFDGIKCLDRIQYAATLYLKSNLPVYRSSCSIYINKRTKRSSRSSSNNFFQHNKIFQ